MNPNSFQIILRLQDVCSLLNRELAESMCDRVSNFNEDSQLGVGGAFGSREDLSVQAHAALLALHTGRPIAMTVCGEVERDPARPLDQARDLGSRLFDERSTDHRIDIQRSGVVWLRTAPQR